MVFIGILSVSVVLIINNTVAAYRRGMTLNHINTVGMDMVDELRAAVQNASSRSISADCEIYYRDNQKALTACRNDGGYKFVTVAKNFDQVEIGNDSKTTLTDIPAWGAFCTGTYSYIWNSGYFINTSDTNRVVRGADKATLTYKYKGTVKTIYGSTKDGLAYSNDEGISPFRILKVYDDRRAVCVSTVRPYSGGRYNDEYSSATVASFGGNFNISEGYPELNEEPVELILADEYSDLVVYDLAVQRPVESSTQKNSFYAVSFILGTIRGGIDITAKGKSCETPENYVDGNFDYCAINKFNFAVQASGE